MGQIKQIDSSSENAQNSHQNFSQQQPLPLNSKQAGRSHAVRAPSQNGQKVAERAGKSALTKSPNKKATIDVSPTSLVLKKQKSAYLSDEEKDERQAKQSQVQLPLMLMLRMNRSNASF